MNWKYTPKGGGFLGPSVGHFLIMSTGIIRSWFELPLLF